MTDSQTHDLCLATELEKIAGDSYDYYLSAVCEHCKCELSDERVLQCAHKKLLLCCENCEPHVIEDMQEFIKSMEGYTS